MDMVKMDGLKKKCKVEGCSSLPTRPKWGVCEKHHARFRRSGGYGLIPPKERYVHSGGYIIVRDSECKLSRNGVVYEHRKVFYEKNGDGPFGCNWCGSEVTWGNLHIDHLDGVKDNNDISNLVASCALCNQARGREKMITAIREKSGRFLTYKGETLTCNEWAKKVGISRTTIMNRLDNIGMSVEEAFEKPVGKTGPKHSKKRRGPNE